MVRLLDVNVLVALLVPEHEHHSLAIDFKVGCGMTPSIFKQFADSARSEFCDSRQYCDSCATETSEPTDKRGKILEISQSGRSAAW